MKSRKSSTSKLTWTDPIETLVGNRSSATLEKLRQAGVQRVSDLLWLFPLKTHIIPPVANFTHAEIGSHFQGIGKVLSCRERPNFRAFGKGRVPLINIDLTVQDISTPEILVLKWFNTYPSLAKKLRTMTIVKFLGVVSEYQGTLQLITPEVAEFSADCDESPAIETLKITYPTINGISGAQLKKIFDKIPKKLWVDFPESLSAEILSKRKMIPIGDAFQIIHGKSTTWGQEHFTQAQKRLIYEEFFNEQIKINLRKTRVSIKKAPVLSIPHFSFNKFTQFFPYQLTLDQLTSVNEIYKDMIQTRPMMRMIQGDVGCGKTTVAFIAALMAAEAGFQTAIMCPTEALCLQHYLEAEHLLSVSNKNIQMLTGSHSVKDKRQRMQELENGMIDIIIGTHSLFQKDVQFKNLGLAIIDEQHKFGVEQRILLTSKAIDGCHCLTMTATPIPRSLSLTRYGDLEISTIKTMPSNRKGQKTRIVMPEMFSHFLNFVKTRLDMKEQIYIVVPAIEESEALDISNVEDVKNKFHSFFPDHLVQGLHGKLKSQEKNQAFIDFKNKKIDILVATSVIEVGINVINATVMAIINPERFGLSSLHQLRGRVGRGHLPGFCFLVCDKKISMDSLNRLRVIEKYNDGFKIAEEDLLTRGEGDIFGSNQSGNESFRKIANIIEHQDLLFVAKEDADTILSGNKMESQMKRKFDLFKEDARVYSTI